jgi:hypothetical protein
LGAAALSLGLRTSGTLPRGPSKGLSDIRSSPTQRRKSNTLHTQARQNSQPSCQPLKSSNPANNLIQKPSRPRIVSPNPSDTTCPIDLSLRQQTERQMRQRWKPAIAATVAIALGLAVSGCADQSGNLTKIENHKTAVSKIPADVVNQCTADLNVKTFGDTGTQTWKFLEPVAPDDRIACLLTPNFSSPILPRTVYYSARIEQVSGSPGKAGSQTLYWCQIQISPDTNKAVVIGHQAGFSLTVRENIFSGDTAQIAKKCGLPLERARTIFDLLPTPTASTARP